MNNWQPISVEQVCEKVCVGFVGTYSNALSNEVEGVPMIRTMNLTGQGVVFENLTFVTKEFHQKNKKSQLKYGDILIARHGDNGKACMYKETFEANCLNVVIVRPDTKKVDPNFFLYQFNSPLIRDEISSRSSGSVQDVINTKEIGKLKLSFPSLKEQQSIAEVLSSLDDKIDLLHRQNKTLEQMAETLFRQWFVEEAKDVWPSDILDNLFDIGIGRTPPRKEQHWFTTNPNDFKWISIKDMGNEGVYMGTSSEYLTAQAVEKFNIPIIPADTVILSFKMTIGRLGITTERMLSNEAIAHFKLKKDSTLYPEYLYLYLKTYRWEQLGSTSSIVEAINSKMIKEMELVVPSNNTLVEFKKIIDPYFLKVKQNQKQLKNLISLRDLLLPKLMNGTVRVINN